MVLQHVPCARLKSRCAPWAYTAGWCKLTCTVPARRAICCTMAVCSCQPIGPSVTSRQMQVYCDGIMQVAAAEQKALRSIDGESDPD